MDYKTLLEFMGIAEKLKCNTRHSWTSSGRKESVAEHTFRLGIFAWLIKDELEFRDLNMERVMQMCLFHDLGEAITGDIPAFDKNDKDRVTEELALESIVSILPQERGAELSSILLEIKEEQTPEARLFQALDKMEAVIQHNEADLSTWLPLERELQLTYGEEKAKAFPYTQKLQELVKQQSIDKMNKEQSTF